MAARRNMSRYLLHLPALYSSGPDQTRDWISASPLSAFLFEFPLCGRRQLPYSAHKHSAAEAPALPGKIITMVRAIKIMPSAGRRMPGNKSREIYPSPLQNYFQTAHSAFVTTSREFVSIPFHGFISSQALLNSIFFVYKGHSSWILFSIFSPFFFHFFLHLTCSLLTQ